MLTDTLRVMVNNQFKKSFYEKKKKKKQLMFWAVLSFTRLCLKLKRDSRFSQKTYGREGA